MALTTRKSMSTLQWEKSYDDFDNVYYEAPSAIGEDGSPFIWKIISSRRHNFLEWSVTGDAELVGEGIFEVHDDSLSAAIAVQAMEDEMVRQSQEEWDALSPEERERLKEEAGY